MHEHDEQTTLPPETGGIAQQPTPEELSAIAGAYEAQDSSRPKTIYIVVLVALFVLIAVAMFVMWSTANTAQNDMYSLEPELVEVELEQEEIPLEVTEDQSLVDYIFAGTFVELLGAQLTYKDFDTQWKDRGLDFTLQRVYDLGVVSSRDFVVATEYLGKKIVVVELRVVNTLPTGEPIEVRAHNYVATRYEQTDTAAADWREVLLAPGEETTVFVPFVLDRNSLDYFILSGDLRNPFVLSMQAPTASPVPEVQ